MKKKYPNKAHGAHTVQDNMRKKYQEEAWREISNYMDGRAHDGGDAYIRLIVTTYVEDFMASKGITPKEEV